MNYPFDFLWGMGVGEKEKSMSMFHFINFFSEEDTLKESAFETYGQLRILLV